MGSVTANLPSLASLFSLGTVVPMGQGTITCLDGTVVQMTQQCLDGVAGASRSPGLPLVTTSDNIEITIINKVMTAISTTPNSINTLAGGVLSTNKADASPIINTIQPTAAIGLVNTVATAEVNTANGKLVPTVAAAINNGGNILQGVGKEIRTKDAGTFASHADFPNSGSPMDQLAQALGSLKWRRRGVKRRGEGSED